MKSKTHTRTNSFGLKHVLQSTQFTLWIKHTWRDITGVRERLEASILKVSYHQHSEKLLVDITTHLLLRFESKFWFSHCCSSLQFYNLILEVQVGHSSILHFDFGVQVGNSSLLQVEFGSSSWRFFIYKLILEFQVGFYSFYPSSDFGVQDKSGFKFGGVRHPSCLKRLSLLAW